MPLARGQTTLKDVKMKPASPPRPQPAVPRRRRPGGRRAGVTRRGPASCTSVARVARSIQWHRRRRRRPRDALELPPAVRADIERQLALWRKSRRSAPARRPPPKKPRTLDAFLAAPAPAPAAPPPTQVDEPAVAQITSMGFSRKGAPLRRSSRPTVTCHARSSGSCRELCSDKTMLYLFLRLQSHKNLVGNRRDSVLPGVLLRGAPHASSDESRDLLEARLGVRGPSDAVSTTVARFSVAYRGRAFLSTRYVCK